MTTAKTVWIANFVRALKPFARRSPRSPAQSSTAPSRVKTTIVPMGKITERPRIVIPNKVLAFSNTVMSKTGITIITPPMVGVPSLVKCRSGPSTRIALPTLKYRKTRSKGGPQITVSIKLKPASATAIEEDIMNAPPEQLRCVPYASRGSP